MECDGPERDAYDMALFNSFLLEIEERANALSSPDLMLAKIKLKNTAVHFQVGF